MMRRHPDLAALGPVRRVVTVIDQQYGVIVGQRLKAPLILNERRAC